jgi:hypothetical protein
MSIAFAMPSGSSTTPQVMLSPADAAQRLGMSKGRVQHLCLAYRVRVTDDQERLDAELRRGVPDPRPVDRRQHIGELECEWLALTGPKKTIYIYRIPERAVEEYQPNPDGLGKPAGTKSGSTSRPLAQQRTGAKSATTRPRRKPREAPEAEGTRADTDPDAHLAGSRTTQVHTRAGRPE